MIRALNIPLDQFERLFVVPYNTEPFYTHTQLPPSFCGVLVFHQHIEMN
jgi:hypothetical protein